MMSFLRCMTALPSLMVQTQHPWNYWLLEPHNQQDREFYFFDLKGKITRTNFNHHLYNDVKSFVSVTLWRD